MREQEFREVLLKQSLDSSVVEDQISFIQNLEKQLQKRPPGWALEDLNRASTQNIVDEMIDRSENTINNLQAMARYARVIHNQDLFITIFQMLDCYEAMEGLYHRLGEVVGEDLRDVVFEDMPLPPLGISRREKARYTYRIMKNLLEVFGESTCHDILKPGLRYLPDHFFSESKEDYWTKCNGDMDRYLQLKGEKFLAILKHHQTTGELFFGQEINDDVLAFVEGNPEIGMGIREGNIIYETKIPYNTKEYLRETDPGLRRYHYCHCPWARESLKGGVMKIPAVFCQCSAGFHKKTYEVIFGETLEVQVLSSVLNGDDVCRFAIYLPNKPS